MRQSTLHRIGWPVAVAIPWRALLAALLLSVLLAAAFSQRPTADTAAPIAPAVKHATLVHLPLAAQGPISAALGADASSYHFGRSHGGVEGINGAQRLTTRFTSGGIEVASAATRLDLSLRGIGYGKSLTSVRPSAPTFYANRVVYAHAQVSEWYANGPRGLEQGFTLAHAPASHSTGPLTLSLAIAGDARASLAAGARSVTFTGAAGPSMRYGGLLATDARGRTLHSWMALTHGHLLLRVLTRDARYPIRIDPIFDTEPEQKLAPTDEQGEARFGYSVAVSGDGTTVVIGGPSDTGHFGAAWVFVRSGSEWVQQGPKLQEESGSEAIAGEHCGEGSEGEADECSFGRRVAVSADGNTVLIGSPGDSGLVPMAGGEELKSLPYVGAAWVFTRAGGKWTEQSKLTGTEEGGEGRFGKSVALSADGRTALIGGSSDHSGQGAAWVFTREGATWAQQGPKLTGGEEQGEPHFGGAVALSGDGQTALIGGPGDDEYVGAAWVFTRTPEGSTWAQQGHKLVAGDEQGAGHLGVSVALSSDGNTALVGGLADDENRGAAWVFTRSGPNWTQQGPKLTVAAPEQRLGSSVALSADGNSALLGGPKTNGARGAAWLFERSGSSWAGAPQTLSAPGETGRAWFGYGVALSADAKVALVGAPNEDVEKIGAGGNVERTFGIGGVWAYSANPRPLITQVRPAAGPAAGGTEVRIAGTNFEDVSSVKFGAASASFTVESRNAIVAFSPPGTGVVDVTVTNSNGTSTAQEKDQFTYIGSEPASGGTVILTTGAGGATGAGGGVLAFTAASGACRVSLVKRSILVKSHSRAVFKLTSKGPGTCRGRLKLYVNVKAAKRRTRTKTIAAGSFSIAAGKARTITLKLNAAGRALLSAGRGRLSARLSILRLSPAPRVTLTSAVRLASQKRKTT